jgi:hypothetical protein
MNDTLTINTLTGGFDLINLGSSPINLFGATSPWLFRSRGFGKNLRTGGVKVKRKKPSKDFAHWLFASVLLLSLLAACGKPQLAQVQVTPETETLMVGESATFKAVGLSAKGDIIPDTQFHWIVEGEAGSIDQSGRFTAERPGQGHVIAAANGVTGRASVTVKASPEPALVQEEEAASVTTAAVSGLDIPDIILIENQVYASDKKGAIALTHKKHAIEYQIACTECHHEYEGGENAWKSGDPVKNCSECHSPEVQEEGGVIKLQTAYHRNCKNCHKQLVEENKSEIAPWRKCADCHQEQAAENQ